MHWDLDEHQKELLSFARDVFTVRAEHHELCEALGKVTWTASGAQPSAVTWLRRDAAELTSDDWLDGELRAFALRVGVGPTTSPANAGKTLVVAINGSAHAAKF
jgi:pullulanase/glycogen debranching enzyme